MSMVLPALSAQERHICDALLAILGGYDFGLPLILAFAPQKGAGYAIPTIATGGPGMA